MSLVAEYPRLFKRLMCVFGKDIAQDALVSMWEHGVDNVDNLDTYAYVTAKHRVHRVKEKKCNQEVPVGLGEISKERYTRPSQDSWVEVRELASKYPELILDAFGVARLDKQVRWRARGRL